MNRTDDDSFDSLDWNQVIDFFHFEMNQNDSLDGEGKLLLILLELSQGGFLSVWIGSGMFLIGVFSGDLLGVNFGLAN